MNSDPTGMIFGMFGIGFMAVMGIFVLAVIAFWIWMLIDCIQREFPPQDQNAKIIWILVIIFAGWIGALIYLLVVKKVKKTSLP